MVILFSTPAAAELIQALSWTLVHSLWQGILLSLVAAIIVFATQKTNPQTRYNLLAAAMLFFVIAVTTTFSLQVEKARQVEDKTIFSTTNQTVPIELQLLTTEVDKDANISNKLVAFVDTNATEIALMWLVFILLQFIRLTAGLYSVYRLKNKEISCAGEFWNSRINELSSQLQIKKTVQLLQSGMVKMPAAVGYFKPVILFPVGMLTSLPPAEAEAVLLHELAHIRRHDFLINLLQQMAEIIFFFNPAVWWVSSLLKTERENCCDEMAMQQTGNRQNYIRALLSFQALDLPFAAAPANGFNGGNNHLLNRVKRIINNNNKTLNNMEKKLLAAGIIITSILLFSFTSSNAWQKPLDKIIASEEKTTSVTQQEMPNQTLQSDTVPVPEPATEESISGDINTTQNGKKYRLVTANNQVKELYVNGKKVPAEKLAEYKKVTDKILTESKYDLELSKKEMAESAKEMEQANKEMEESKIEMAQSAKELAIAAVELDQAQKEMEVSAKQMLQNKEQFAKDLEQSRRDMAQAKLDLAQAKIEMEKAQKEMEADQRQAKLDMEQSARDMEQAIKDMEQAARDEVIAKRDEKQAKELQEKIVKDFISGHIINSKSDLKSFEINNEKLVVNGVTQPDAIFKQFKSKYVKSKQFSMMYNYK